MTTDDRWMQSGNCQDILDPDVTFFPVVPKGAHVDYTAAKKICEDCPVQRICLTYAIAHRISEGVWGGLSPYERKRLPRETRIHLRKMWWGHFPITHGEGRRTDVSPQLHGR